jgi:hypothetical protein
VKFRSGAKGMFTENDSEKMVDSLIVPKLNFHERSNTFILCPSGEDYMCSLIYQHNTANKLTGLFTFGLTLLIRDWANLQHSNKATAMRIRMKTLMFR